MYNDGGRERNRGAGINGQLYLYWQHVILFNKVQQSTKNCGRVDLVPNKTTRVTNDKYKRPNQICQIIIHIHTHHHLFLHQMAPKPVSTASKAPASTAASKAPAKTTDKAKKATKTSAAAAAGADGEKKKRRKVRKETYSSYIYKGMYHQHLLQFQI